MYSFLKKVYEKNNGRITIKVSHNHNPLDNSAPISNAFSMSFGY